MTEDWFEKQEAIGGKGSAVEIDETLIVRRKHDIGRVLSEICLFGGFGRGGKKCFFVPLVDKDNYPIPRNKDKLIAIIHKFVKDTVNYL